MQKHKKKAARQHNIKKTNGPVRPNSGNNYDTRFIYLTIVK